MDILRDCALNFQKLFGVDYQITAVKEQKEISVVVYFSEEHFHHLIGLNKLRDIEGLQGNRTQVFTNILNGKLTYDDIRNSAFIETVNERIKYFTQLESLLQNEIVIKFDKRKAHSTINATMLLYQKQDDVYLHLFLTSKNGNSEILIPCSFFPRKDNMYIVHQEVYKVVEIKKVDHIDIKEQGRGTLEQRILSAKDKSVQTNQLEFAKGKHEIER